jgi:hypothetical protein
VRDSAYQQLFLQKPTVFPTVQNARQKSRAFFVTSLSGWGSPARRPAGRFYNILFNFAYVNTYFKEYLLNTFNRLA